MTLREFICKLASIKEELQDKKVVIRASNGLLVEPQIRYIRKKNLDAEDFFKLNKKTVKQILISSE